MTIKIANARIVIKCVPLGLWCLLLTQCAVNVSAQSFDSLNINNINARINAGGSLFWNMDIQAPQPGFEVPRGGGKHTILGSDLWIGAIRNGGGDLHLAGHLYGGITATDGKSFWQGPVMDSLNYSGIEDSLWNRVWKIDKNAVDIHIANWTNTGYSTPQSLLDWPGNGDQMKGQASILAPFFDRNMDEVYDPSDGDYPIIKGDQAVYFIFNDDRGIQPNGGKKLKIEIHGMVYAFKCEADSALFNTVFLNYKVINRSNNTYDSTYIGMFTNPDIGEASDDFIESDVERGSFFCFNGTPMDGSGAPGHYGPYPPAQSVTFLRGPEIPEDGLDNSLGGCDASINGHGFEDGIIDNESHGMTGFNWLCTFPGGIGSICGNPDTPIQYYNFMQGIWKDGTKLLYGDGGHNTFCSSCEEAHFMFSGSTDPCSWGTNGTPPADSVPWTEIAAGNSSSDRNGVGFSGPATFLSNDTMELDFAFVTGRDYVDTTGNLYRSVNVMKERIDSVRSYFRNNSTPCGDTFTSVEKLISNPKGINIYPNPTSDILTVFHSNSESIRSYSVYNLYGQEVIRGDVNIGIDDSKINIISVENLSHGIYVLKVSYGTNVRNMKFLKL